MATANPSSARNTNIYDAGCRVEATVNPLGARSTAVYDCNQLLANVDPLGNRTLIQNGDTTVTTVYDNVNRRQSASSTMDSATKTISYAYDSLGNRSHMILPDGGRFTYAYDAANRITRLANLKSDGTTISSFEYGYDNVGNRTHVIEANGDRVSWTYDAANQLSSERRSGANAYAQTFAYDPAANRTLKDIDGARTTCALRLECCPQGGRVMHDRVVFALLLLSAMWVTGGLINVCFPQGVIDTVKSIYAISPIKPVGLTVPIVRAVGYFAIALGIVVAIFGLVQALRRD